jgi:hypothetical protein
MPRTDPDILSNKAGRIAIDVDNQKALWYSTLGFVARSFEKLI